MSDTNLQALSQITKVTNYQPESLAMQNLGVKGKDTTGATTSARDTATELRRRRVRGGSEENASSSIPGDFTSVITGEAVGGGDAGDVPDEAALMQQHTYLRDTAKMVRKAMAYPTELTDNTALQHTINLVAELLRPSGAIAMNMVSSLVYQQVGSGTFTERLPAKAAYALVGVAIDTLLPEAVAYLKRQAGGTDTKIFANPPFRKDRSPVGAYNEAYGAALKGLLQTYVYGAVTSLIYRYSTLEGLGLTGLATMSGVGTAALAGQVLNMGVVGYTLHSVGAESHDDLETRRNNHDHRIAWLSGTTSIPAAARERTTPKEKAIEVGLTGLVATARQASIFAIQMANKFDPLRSPASYQVQTVFASFTVGAAVGLLSRMAVLRFRSDSIEHRLDFNVIANQLLCDRLEASHLITYGHTLDAVANDLGTPRPPGLEYETPEAAEADQQARELFSAAVSLMRTDAANLHEGRDIDADLDRLGTFFTDIRDEYIRHYEDAQAQADRSAGSLSKAAELLVFICRDLKNLKAHKAGRGASGDAVYGPYYSDMLQRMYGLAMLTYQAGMIGKEAESGQEEDTEEREAAQDLLSKLIPVLAGVQKGERLQAAKGALSTLHNITTLRTNSALARPTRWASILASLGISPLETAAGQILGLLTSKTNPLYANDMLQHIEEQKTYQHEGRQTVFVEEVIGSLRQVGNSQAAWHDGNGTARLQLLILEGALRRSNGLVEADEADEADPTLAAVLRFAGAQRMPGHFPAADEAPAPNLVQEWGALEHGIAAGRIDIKRLALALADHRTLLSVPEEQIESGLGPGPTEDNLRDALKGLRSAAGIASLAALHGEAGVGALQAASGELLIDNITHDIENMHHIVRRMLEVSLMIGQVPGAVDLRIHPQNDAHAHYDNFNMLDVVLKNLFEVGASVGIISFLLMSIPNIIARANDRVKYYGINPHPSSYRDGDGSAIRQRADQEGHVISMTGFIEFEGFIEQYQKHLIHKMRNDKDRTASWIGETSDRKYTLTDNMLSPVENIRNHARYVMLTNAHYGFGKTGHHDIGGPHGEEEFGDDIVAALIETVKLLEGDDPLKGPPGTEVPPPVLMHVVPHFGVSPQNSGGPKLTKFWCNTFSNPLLKGKIGADTSWKVTARVMANNTRDQVRPISPRIAEAMEAWGVFYDAFAGVVGKRADKNTDLPKLMKEAGVHYAGAESLAGLIALSVANIQKVTEYEMKSKPNVREDIAKLTREHGEKGNNWLYLLANFSDCMMFGTDVLGEEVLIHGQAVMMADALQLHPMYAFFDALVKTDPDPASSEFRDVVPNIARNTFNQKVRNEALARRREYAYRFVSTVKPSDAKRALGNVVRYINQIDPTLDAEFATLNTRVDGPLTDQAEGEQPPREAMSAYVTAELMDLVDGRPAEVIENAGHRDDPTAELENIRAERRRRQASQLPPRFVAQVCLAVTSALTALSEVQEDRGARDWPRERVYGFLTQEVVQVMLREGAHDAFTAHMKACGWDSERIRPYLAGKLETIDEEDTTVSGDGGGDDRGSDMDDVPPPPVKVMDAVLGTTEWLDDDQLRRGMDAMWADLRQSDPARAVATGFLPPAVGRLAAVSPELAQEALGEVFQNAGGADNLQRLIVPVSDHQATLGGALVGGGRHWSLLLIDRLTGQANHYDSLPPGGEVSLGQAVRAQTLARNLFPDVQFSQAPMARQNNGYDCGVAVLAATQELLRTPPANGPIGASAPDLSALAIDRLAVGQMLR